MPEAHRIKADSAALGAAGALGDAGWRQKGAGPLHDNTAGTGADAPENSGTGSTATPPQQSAAGHSPLKQVAHAKSGAGNTTFSVHPGAVLEINTAVPTFDTIQFEAGYGTLELGAPGSMAATIVGFTGTAPAAGQSDVIDLVGVGALDSSNLSYSAASGVLSVTNDAGATIAALHLSGNYTNDSFKAASDGAGGTNIFDLTSNAIVLENQLAGTPESVWAINGDISNVGNDAAIQGFATSMSVNPGQTENFKIDTGSTKYRIDIYRLGYYGGNGARLISTQTTNLASAQVQPNPLFDSTTNEVDAGNWAVSASWAVPATAVSGVYFAKLTTLNGTIGQNMIPFVVTNGGAASAVKFQTNDATWEAYNPWGGYNLYQGPSGTTGDRANAVSYNRPIDMNSNANESGPQDYVFSGEFPALYWLEQNGYDVSYITNSDAANTPSLLANAKVLMDSGHDEYWSASQYNNVKAAAKAGTSLVFLSGNQVYWDVAYGSGPSGAANTTVIEYKDPWAGKQINPNGTAGGGSSDFRDPVNGPGTPENALTGNIFQVDGSNKLGDVSVPYNLSQFRLWANTSVAGLAPGGSATLGNLLGYEWNTDNNNGFRPAGVIDLSSTTVGVGTLLLDYGLNTGAGDATHNLTLYRDATSGALIFNAGTVMWSWGLDAQHPFYQGQTAPVSPTVEQAMVNLLADMGVQPQTLLSTLAFATQSTDTTPPISKITSVGSGGALTANQIVTITGTAADSGGGKVASVEISTDGGKTWNRAIGFNNWTYSWITPAAGTYTVATRATNDSAYLEKPSDAVSVTVAAGSTSSLFNASPGDVIPNSTVSDTLDAGDSNPVELGVQFVSSRAGTITGVRFWKGVNDAGSHVGSLWAASGGTPLATGTFVNETAVGWQTLAFASPVAITAGTSYVAGYHSNGHYAADSNYFTKPYTNGPLSTGGAGAPASLFAYGASSVFPTASGAGTNYWVDAVFAPAGANQPPVANNDSGFVATQNTPLPIVASALLGNDTDPNGLALSVSGVSGPTNGAVAFNAGTNTVTFTPTTGYTGTAGFTYSISDTAGLTASANVSLAVSAPGATPASLWTTATKPAVLAEKDPSPVELGMRFTASVAGTITGLRYYKSVNDTGTHIGSLWTNSGALKANATFGSETASGWQTVNFTTPVAIDAGATYVAAYHSNGNYADSAGYFTSAYSNGPLTALASGSGGNGLYAYNSGSVFPTSTYNATNYWVDVLFQAGQAVTPAAPAAKNDSGFVAIQNSPLLIDAATLLANDTDPNGLALSVSGVSSPTNGTVAFDASAKTITFTPTAGYTGAADFTYSIADSAGGAASAKVVMSVAGASTLTASTLFTPSSTPGTVTANDPSAVELGTKFTSANGGTITGMQFYKGPKNTGTHTAELWNAKGALLETAPFTNETASGWQSVTFAKPVAIAAGETDVASYHTAAGFYSVDANYFATAHANGALTAPSNASSGGNGVYAYGASAFPTNTYTASNYWVDVTMKA